MKYWVGDATINFVPSALMAASGGAAMPLFFASGFGSKISDFELNKKNAVKFLPALESSLKQATSEKEKIEIQKQEKKQSESTTPSGRHQRAGRRRSCCASKSRRPSSRIVSSSCALTDGSARLLAGSAITVDGRQEDQRCAARRQTTTLAPARRGFLAARQMVSGSRKCGARPVPGRCPTRCPTRFPAYEYRGFHHIALIKDKVQFIFDECEMMKSLVFVSREPRGKSIDRIW